MWYPRSQRSQKSILSSSAGSWKYESCKMRKICNFRTKTIIALFSWSDLPDTSCTVCSPCTPTRSWWRSWSSRARGQHRWGGTRSCTSSSAVTSPAGSKYREIKFNHTETDKAKNCCQRLLHFAQQLTCPALLWFMLPWHILQMALGRISSTFFIGPFVSFLTSSFTFSCFSFTSLRGRPLANKNKWRVVSENLTF